MAAQLPKFIDLRHLVEDAREIAGSVPPQQLTRIAHPYFPVGAVDVRLSVDTQHERGPRLRGELQSVVGAQCQRCLQDFELLLKRSVDVVLVDPQSESGTPDEAFDVDEVAITDGQFHLYEFVEDEVILACPMIPMHENDTCKPSENATTNSQERRKPFENLAQLLAEAKK